MPAPNAVTFCDLKRSEAKLRVYVRCRQTLRPFPALPYRQHVQCTCLCPLWAKSGHQGQSLTLISFATHSIFCSALPWPTTLNLRFKRETEGGSDQHNSSQHTAAHY